MNDLGLTILPLPKFIQQQQERLSGIFTTLGFGSKQSPFFFPRFFTKPRVAKEAVALDDNDDNDSWNSIAKPNYSTYSFIRPREAKLIESGAH